jgi:hypothetical protein
MIDNCIIIKKKLEEVREMAQQNRLNMERGSRDNGGRKGYDDEDMGHYQDMKNSYGMTEVKKRRGVSVPHRSRGSGNARRTRPFTTVPITNSRNSGPLHQAGATAAIGLTPRNGDEDQTAPGLFAMPVAYITQSWSARDNSSKGRSGRSQLRSDPKSKPGRWKFSVK